MAPIVQSNLSEQLVELVPRLRRFARGLTSDKDKADDLVQSACERFLKHHARLRPDTKLDSWMYRVIYNLFIDGTREQSVRDRNAGEVRYRTELRLVSNNPVEQRLRLHEVHEAMQQLSEEHRSALMLICVEGLSYKEAAEVFDVPVGTMASRVVRARQALLDAIGEDGADGTVGAST